MADSWYYAHDGVRIGPFTGRQLRNLADSGEILTTDTVWKTGVEHGVPATRVKLLFPAPQAEAPVTPAQPLSPPPEAAPAASEPVLTDVPEEARLVEVAPEAPPPPAYQSPARRRTAVAGKGAMIMGQDGTYVKFKKKCTTCNHEDSSWATMAIVNGTMKAGFFCPKCRKRREVELRGQQG